MILIMMLGVVPVNRKSIREYVDNECRGVSSDTSQE